MQHNHPTALLVMDVQNAILQRIEDTTTFVQKVAQAIAHARAENIPVIYVVVAFRADAPEISDRNKSFAAFHNKAMWTPAFAAQWAQIHPDLQPENGDIIVIKRRYSAFTGSDLEVILRAKGIQHLVLTGVSTSGVVLSTVREAADKDYELTVIADCCADRDAEVQQVLTTKVFPVQATVTDLATWIR
ncbi:cysteine hydrolase family protein [Chitinophaga nivalis]|uniref:Cysteine hydrolase n=1 Tax=Chitinophaga nivalis TaxID=2991709 RepID=A0ABT3IIX2_9BACT|nr:isochorismatase family cysteine hydrolase [Chitinophaga nivalis]MCW3466398.1 cysteine hydrolase [Chitinophaga nivalis]MCW3483911.1 cysteine hydrolase [Chitinophaga nivalis]